MKIMLLYASGYNFDHWSFVLDPLKCRAMQRTFPSSTYLVNNTSRQLLINLAGTIASVMERQ